RASTFLKIMKNNLSNHLHRTQPPPPNPRQHWLYSIPRCTEIIQKSRGRPVRGGPGSFSARSNNGFKRRHQRLSWP
ncbi:MULTISPECIES: hypothetical protein, partial [unclassified Herbaspirillum]|uniref:hypothetical protein n=1 Tax=unclassified Herbaspirillum TaxID=2624150 RepID=UPI001C85701B